MGRGRSSSSRTPCAGKVREVLVAVDGPGAYAEHLADVPEVGSRQVEVADVLLLPDQALVAPPGRLLDLAVVVPWPVGHDGSRTEGFVAPVFGRGLRRDGFPQGGSLLEQELLERQGEVVQQVPSVGDLNGAGGALRQGLAVDVQAVPGSKLHPWVALQPGDEALLRANAQSIVPLIETLCAMRYSAIHSGSAGEPI